MAAKKSNKQRTDQPHRRKETTTAGEPQSPTPPPSPVRRPMPWFGWLGLGILIVSQILMLANIHPVDVAFTPIMWTGYILLIDGWIWARGHESFFKDRKLEWPMLALFSFLIWVMFEAFNFSLKAWWYVNSPTDFMLKSLNGGWAYATIIPAMLRTRSLFNTFDRFHFKHPTWRIKFTPFLLSLSFVVGIAFTFIPVMFEYPISNLLVPCVWLGLIFLIEPIIYRMGVPSVFYDLEKGKISFVLQLLAAGLVCGLLWESWNGELIPHKGIVWNYNIHPIYHIVINGIDLHLGAMPLLGFLGYPPFIWECFALWELIKWAMHGDTWWNAAND
jgi:hypothetical protein